MPRARIYPIRALKFLAIAIQNAKALADPPALQLLLKTSPNSVL
jgi:hypothetical protein